MWDPYAEFRSATLPNGLTIHAAHWPSRPWEAMGFLIHSGAKHDPVGLEGLAHFVEHVVSENLNVSKKDMNEFFDEHGGLSNLGTTSHLYTKYNFFVPTTRETVAKALSMFGEMLLSARIEKAVERERQVIIGEFHRHYPMRYAFDLDTRGRKAVYEGYWLERFVRPLGNPESVGRITQEDLQFYYDKHYAPANMSVVGVGSLSLDQLTTLVSESPFGTIKPGIRTPLAKPASESKPPSEKRHVFEVSRHISMAVPSEVGQYRSIVKIPATVKPRSVKIIGDMLNEELNEQVRERRAWAYHIGTSRNYQQQFWEFEIQCRGLALTALDEIEEVVESVVASLGDREELFERVKRRTLARNHMIDPTGKGICDGALDDLVTDQRIVSLAEYAEEIQRVTLADIRETLQWLRPQQRWTLLVRP